MSIAWIVAGVMVTMALVAYMVFNRLVALDERCQTAFSDIDVHLKHRHAVIPALVESVRAFAGLESRLIDTIVQARAKALGAALPEARLEAEATLGQGVVALIHAAEAYPELQASGHFRDLRIGLTDIENRITASRRYFNLTVDEFNATLRQFPGNVIGGLARLHRRKRFDLGVERILLDEPVALGV